MKNLRNAAVAALLLGTAPAFAGPATDNANTHFKAIAAGDVEALMRGYGPDATLQWVGGPLDGVYHGDAKLQELWKKFTAAQGQLELKVANEQESTNPNGATVTANVEFKGKAPIKVRYVLTYREGKIVNEVWQIDPALTF